MVLNGWQQKIGLLENRLGRDVDWGAVIAALVTVVGGILTTLLVILRGENKDDHAMVISSLDRLADGMERVEDKIDSHITDHAKGVL
jgi:hypothetical protein